MRHLEPSRKGQAMEACDRTAKSVEPSRRGQPGRLGAAALGLAYAALFTLALGMRLRDPLSTSLIGAEDPHTHIVIVKELTANGYIAGARSLDYPLYPPGLHILVSALWSLTGLSIHTVARFLPPVIGAFGVLALATFLHEETGPVGGLAGGIVAATVPEHIFRTNLLFPTALDLLLLPAFLLLLVRLSCGAWAASAGAALLAATLVLSHPWIALLVAPVGIGYAALRALFPPAATPRRVGHTVGVAAVAASMGALAYAWWADAGFLSIGSFMSRLAGSVPYAGRAVGVPAPALLALGTVAVGAAAAACARTGVAPRLRPLARAGAGVALLGVAWAVTAHFGGTPQPKVNYEQMFGSPAILLAFAGILGAVVARSPAGDVGLIIAWVTYPLTAVDYFGGAEYWPHRSAAYLSLGVILLAGAGVQAITDTARRIGRISPRLATPATFAVGAVTLVVVTATAVPVGMDTYRWDRYYDETEYGIIEEARAIAGEDPDAVILVSRWQPNLFLRSMGEDLPRGVVWVGDKFFDDHEWRDERVKEILADGHRPYLLVDKHTYEYFGLDEWEMGPYPHADMEKVWGCCDGKQAIYRIDEPPA